MIKYENTLNYPFSAIVEQDLMKIALILNLIDSKIGGVLIKGERGTSKSTAVRALPSILPNRKVVSNCVFSCNPNNHDDLCELCASKKESLKSIDKKVEIVELPVSATEDMLVGSLNISEAIKHGKKKFEPGTLAAANRNILYVDEVNLLNDHLVDSLLDVAAMGVNVVKREGISYTHPSKFVLIGTMNPEEGDLRPQLLDRFGLSVEVKGISSIDKRLEIINRRTSFDNNPKKFLDKWISEDKKISNKIANAKKLLPYVNISKKLISMIIQICIDYGIEGHRGDITMVKTAKALAAYNQRNEVLLDDIKLSAELVLPHRIKKSSLSNDKFNKEKINESIEKFNEELSNGNMDNSLENFGNKIDSSLTTHFKSSEPFF